MNQKRCVSCRTEKPFYDFNKNKSKKDGYADSCRPCMKAYLRQWSEKNRERKRQMDRDYAANNRERAREKTRQWAADNKEQKKQADQNYRAANRQKLAEHSVTYRAANREKIMAQKRKYAEENRERLLAKQKEWKAANKGKVLANVTLRKMKKKKATPSWLTREQRIEMRWAYELAELLTENLGEPHQVDHIVPICHPLVCGLHVPWNLQVLTAAANREKSNRFEG